MVNSDGRLTKREIEVLRLICDSYSTKQIATRLGISFKTAVAHRTHIMSKAGVHDSIALFRWALERGYVEVRV